MTGLTDGAAAVVFDFFGTLTPVSPDQVWAGNARRLAAALGAPPDALLAALDESFPERITGELGDVRQTLRVLADRLGVQPSADQLDDASQVRREIQESMFVLRPEALPVIRRLRAIGLKIGVLSDCTSELPDAWSRLPLAGLVDAPVFSCIERTRKPDPRLFRTVAANLRAEPAACLYVGDGGGRELTGASDVGMRAVLLAGQDWLAHRSTEIGWTGPRIGSLTDLCP
ncbi:MAG TPA: HAD family hydrolase [Streptosporangiaceae bacterium]|nr:HAD family hydrolase [Streptosporangiaceae bacterium]